MQATINKSATINAARTTYIQHRKAEMLADPEAIIIMSSHLIAAHPAKFGNVINDVMRERVGSLAALIDMMDKAAEDVAQEEWITPIREEA